MEIIFRGDKLMVTEAMKSYVDEKIGKLEKYLENSDDVRCSVVVKVRGRKQIVEITIPLKNFILRSEEEQEDFYVAVDKAITILERQIRKNKTKLMSKQTKTLIDFDFSSIEDDNEESEKQIIKRKKVEIKPMDEEEAIIQMELIGHEFYMYKDSETNKMSVVYKRKDGNYGLIESE